MKIVCKNKKKRIVLLLFVAALAWLLIRPVSVLVLGSEKKGDILLRVKRGEKITLQYVHSIYHVDQHEVYELKGSGFILRSLFFGDRQAAQYYDSHAQYPLTATADGYEMNGLDQDYPGIRFALGHGTRYRIAIASRLRIDLNRTFFDATFLNIRTESMPAAKFFIMRFTNDREVK